MINDFELASKYNDISTSEKPKIPKYHGDMFIDVEQEYLMRKDFQQRIDKAIEYIENVKIMNEEDKEDTMYWEYNTFFPYLLSILKDEDNEKELKTYS